MRILKLAFAFLIALTAVGCETPPNAARTTTGQVIGTTSEEQITAADSLVSVVGSSALITRRVRRQFPERYQETLGLVGGSMFYEKTFTAGFGGESTDAMQLFFRDKFFVDNGLSFTSSAIQSAVNFTGRYKYIVVASDKAKCVVFQEYFGRETPVQGGIAYPEYVVGARCSPPVGPQADALQNDTLDLLGRLRFDGGLLNRGQATR